LILQNKKQKNKTQTVMALCKTNLSLLPRGVCFLHPPLGYIII